MLTINDASTSLSRRKLLSIGSLGLGGMSLASLMGLKAEAAALSDAVRNKSVIFLFQQGGPSQFETFDPKPEADESVRSVCDVIPTSIPGVHLAEHLPRLARLAHKYTNVRSYQTLNANHNIQPMVGPHSLETSVPVHYTRVVGTTRPKTGVPTSTILYPQAVSKGVPDGRARGNLLETGPYGMGFAPFVPGKDGQLQQDMELSLSKERFFGDRRTLLSGLDNLKRDADASGQFEALDEIQKQAYEILLGGGVSRACLLYTSPSPRDGLLSRMPSSA